MIDTTTLKKMVDEENESYNALLFGTDSQFQEMREQASRVDYPHATMRVLKRLALCTLSDDLIIRLMSLRNSGTGMRADIRESTAEGKIYGQDLAADLSEAQLAQVITYCIYTRIRIQKWPLDHDQEWVMIFDNEAKGFSVVQIPNYDN